MALCVYLHITVRICGKFLTDYYIKKEIIREISWRRRDSSLRTLGIIHEELDHSTTVSFH